MLCTVTEWHFIVAVSCDTIFYSMVDDDDSLFCHFCLKEHCTKVVKSWREIACELYMYLSGIRITMWITNEFIINKDCCFSDIFVPGKLEPRVWSLIGVPRRKKTTDSLASQTSQREDIRLRKTLIWYLQELKF